MKTTTFHAVFASAIALLSLPACSATSNPHQRLHQIVARKHTHLHGSRSQDTVKRGTCAFPTDDGNLVAVTPDSQNAGWAMSPDQPCKPNSYCPIACKPGMVMAQWQPGSVYQYPQSMNGGLFCDSNGNVKKPFPNKPNCVTGTGSISAVNECSEGLSFCQTVLPGNEAMLIPTEVSAGGSATLAVPDTSYWDSTAAHYYINGPGSTPADCIWGDPSRPIGNWAPYVAGANTDGNGLTFVKLGWNPIWEGSGLKNTLPSFGIKIECDNCNGMPCQISPNSAGSVDSKEAAVGAGDAAFCVATVPKGGTAKIVVFPIGGGGSSGSGSKSGGSEGGGQFAAQAIVHSTTSTSTSTAAPTTSSSAAPTTTSSTTTTTTTSTTTSAASTTSTTTTSTSETSTTTSSSTSTAQKTSKGPAYPTVNPGVFHENGTTVGNTTIAPTVSQTQAAAAPKTTESKGEAGRQQGSAAFAGLIVAFVAAACFF